jgi:tRNA 5-methylaminomethyl-2-thiouridine biosynthesis bifunctional protein
VVGPVPVGSEAAAARTLLATWNRRLPERSDHWSWRLTPPAERLLLRDNLPMAGAAPDLAAIAAARERHERNDRLALPRREGLFLLTGLGGRGLLWSVLGAEVIAAAAAGEPPLIEPELAEAIDPARFVRRDLRRAQQLRDRTVPAQ